jgi:hypothetical protein
MEWSVFKLFQQMGFNIASCPTHKIPNPKHQISNKSLRLGGPISNDQKFGILNFGSAFGGLFV